MMGEVNIILIIPGLKENLEQCFNQVIFSTK